MSRTPLLTLRVDEETKARWQAAADDAGYSLSEFVRYAVEAQIEGRIADSPFPVPPMEEIEKPLLDRRTADRAPLDRREVHPDPKPGRKR